MMRGLSTGNYGAVEKEFSEAYGIETAFSSRLAHAHNPLPSQNSIFRRLRCALANRKTCPRSRRQLDAGRRPQAEHDQSDSIARNNSCDVRASKPAAISMRLPPIRTNANLLRVPFGVACWWPLISTKARKELQLSATVCLE